MPRSELGQGIRDDSAVFRPIAARPVAQILLVLAPPINSDMHDHLPGRHPPLGNPKRPALGPDRLTDQPAAFTPPLSKGHKRVMPACPVGVWSRAVAGQARKPYEHPGGVERCSTVGRPAASPDLMLILPDGYGVVLPFLPLPVQPD